MDILQISRSFVVNVLHDGDNAVRIDIDNEADIVAVNSSGSVRFGRTIVTKARIYDGGSPALTGVTRGNAASSQTIDSGGANILCTVTGGNQEATIPDADGYYTYSWTFATTDVLVGRSFSVPIMLVYNDVTYTTYFTLTCYDTPYIYQLKPTLSSIPFSRTSSNALTPASRTVGLSVVKIDGNDTTEYTTFPVTGVTVRHSTSAMPATATDGDAWPTTSPYLVSVPNSVSYLYIALFDSTGTLLDRETIPVVKDGSNGSNAIRLALDNQHEDFLYNDAGVLIAPSGGARSQIHIYDGGTDVDLSNALLTIDYSTGKTWGVPTSGATGAPYISSGILRVPTLVEASAKVVVKAYYPNTMSGKEYFAEFTANRTNQDKYDLNVRPNAIAYNPATYPSASGTGTSIILGGKRTDLNGNVTTLEFGAYDDKTKISTTSGKGYIRLFIGIYQEMGPGAYDVIPTQQTATPFIANRYQVENQEFLHVELRKYADKDADSSLGSYTVVDYEDIEIAKVENGTSPYYSDIANEMDSVACDSSGKTVSAYSKTFRVYLWHGSEEMTLSDIVISGATSSVTATKNVTNKTVTVSVASGTTIPATTELTITPKATGAPDNLSVHFVLNGVRPGANGEPAVLFDLMPSVDAIKCTKTGALSPTSFTCSVQKVTGSAVTTATVSDGTLRYRIDGDIAASTDGTAMSIGGTIDDYTNSNSYITLAFFVGSTLRDKERILIVADGTDGTAPWIGDLDNEMDSVSCDDSGYVLLDGQNYQSVSTDIHLFHGNQYAAFSMAVYDENGVAYPNGTFSDGILCSWSNNTVLTNTLTVAFHNTVCIEGKKVFKIVLSSTETLQTPTLYFTVNGIKGDVFNLYPSAGEVVFNIDANNDYTPDPFRITCGYSKKNLNDDTQYFPGTDYRNTATSDSDGYPEEHSGAVYTAPYNILFRFRNADNTYTSWAWLRDSLYTEDNVTHWAWVSINASSTYTAIEFILTAGTRGTAEEKAIDRETIPIIRSGKKGSDGRSVSYVEKYFKATSTNSNPGGDTSTWTYTDPTQAGWSATNKYLWCREKTVYDSGNPTWGSAYLHSVWGEKGDDGDDAPYEVRSYQLGNSSTTPPTGTWVATAPARQVGTFVWMRIQSYDKDGVLQSTSYVCLTGDEGDPGDAGAAGKWYDYAGVWGTDVSSVTNTEYVGYYVLYYYDQNDSSKKHFYMNVKADGTANTTNPANSSGVAQTGWTQISDDREYYIVKAVFGDYAEFGSFIFNGDWMISRQGTVNNNFSDAYTTFDPMFPTEGYKTLFLNIPVTYSKTALSTFNLRKNVTYTFKITVSNTSQKSEYELHNAPYNSGDTAIRTVTFNTTDTTLTKTFNYTPSANGAFCFTVEKWNSSSSLTVTIEIKRTNVFIPNFYVDAKTGTTYQNRGNFRGTVRADNFFHPAALVLGNENGDNTFILQEGGTTKKWIYIHSTDDPTAVGLAESYGFKEGDYFDTANINAGDEGDFQSCWNNADYTENLFRFCTYNADIVTCMNLHNGWDNKVLLPRPSDFAGKVVDVFNNDGNYSASVSAADGSTIGLPYLSNGNLVFDYNNQYKSWTVGKGKTVRFYSVGDHWVIFGASQV